MADKHPLKGRFVPLWLFVSVVACMAIGLIWLMLTTSRATPVPQQDVIEPVRMLGEFKGLIDTTQQEIDKQRMVLDTSGSTTPNQERQVTLDSYIVFYNQLVEIYNRGADQIMQTHGQSPLLNVGLPLKINRLT